MSTTRLAASKSAFSAEPLPPAASGALSRFHQTATAARGVEFEYTRAREYHVGSFDVTIKTGRPSGQTAKY